MVRLQDICNFEKGLTGLAKAKSGKYPLITTGMNCRSCGSFQFDTLKQWWNKREANEQAWKVGINTIKTNGYNLDIKNPHQPEQEKQYGSGELLDLLHQSFAKGDGLLEQLRTELM